MKIISSYVQAILVRWLPVLSNIILLETRRYAVIVKLLQKVQNSPNLPVFSDINKAPIKRLTSRHPIWSIKSTTDKPEDM